MKVQAKVEMARMESTWSQAPAKDKVVMAIKLVITVPHFSIHTHLFCPLSCLFSSYTHQVSGWVKAFFIGQRTKAP